jgi:hypothetical protein
MRHGLLTAVFILAAASAALAEPPARGESDWPCRQVKVAGLSVASIWNGPPIDGVARPTDPATSDLVARLAARRTSLEDAQELIDEFAKAAGDARKERLTGLFASLYDKLDHERSDVVAGLERYGRAQKDFAQKLRDATEKLRQAQDARRDSEEIKELAKAFEWNMRMFEERRKATTYVCESPALIEQRLGALARIIEAAI